MRRQRYFVGGGLVQCSCSATSVHAEPTGLELKPSLRKLALGDPVELHTGLGPCLARCRISPLEGEPEPCAVLPMAMRVLETWNLRYVCTFVWHKPNSVQPIRLPKFNCDFALYARKGSPMDRSHRARKRENSTTTCRSLDFKKAWAAMAPPKQYTSGVKVVSIRAR